MTANVRCIKRNINTVIILDDALAMFEYNSAVRDTCDIATHIFIGSLTKPQLYR